MRRRVLLGLSLLCGAAASFITLWIVLPPLTMALWVVSVGAGEWSLWWGALGLLGALLAGLAARIGRYHRRVWPLRLAFILSALPVALALIPPLQSLPVARRNGVRLSLRHYFFGDREAGERAPVSVETVTFATVDGQPLALDIYRAVPAAGKGAPIVIVIHGGSWKGGDKSDFAHWDRWLARQGFAVFDIQYRLQPAPNWQAATGDVKCAIGWVKRNAARYGADKNRIALLGRSAGGHLALLAAYAPRRDPLLPASCAPGPQDTRVQAVISLYGPTDLVWGYHNPARPDVIDGPGTLRRFLGGDPQTAARAYEAASPTSHITPDSPPTLLFHGGRDQLVSPRHAGFVAERLARAGVPFRAVLIPYAQHGFDYPINGWGSQIVQPVLLDFLRTHLGKPLVRPVSKVLQSRHHAHRY